MIYDKVPAFRSVSLDGDKISCWVNKSLLSYLSTCLTDSKHESVREFSTVLFGYARNMITANTTADEFSFVVCDDHIGVSMSMSKNLSMLVKDLFIYSKNKAVAKLGYEIQKYFMPPIHRMYDSNRCQRRNTNPATSPPIESLIQEDSGQERFPRIWIEGTNFSTGTAVIKFNLPAIRNLVKAMHPCGLKNRLNDLADIIDTNKTEIDETMADMCGEGIDDLFSLQSILSHAHAQNNVSDSVETPCN